MPLTHSTLMIIPHILLLYSIIVLWKIIFLAFLNSMGFCLIFMSYSIIDCFCFLLSSYCLIYAQYQILMFLITSCKNLHCFFYLICLLCSLIRFFLDSSICFCSYFCFLFASFGASRSF